MGQQIVKQPDGKYAIWSTIVDDFILEDATEEEIVTLRTSLAIEYVKDRVHAEIEKLNTGIKSSQFHMTYEECVDYIKKYKGKVVMKPRKVVVTLEIESDMKIKDIKDAYTLRPDDYKSGWIQVNQVQVNVIKAEKK